MSPFVARCLSLTVAATLTVQPVLVPVVRAQTQDLPSLGDAGADDLSPANERRLGEAIMRDVRQDTSYMDDPDSTEYLNTLGFKLVAASPARYTDFRFFLVRDPMMNAFALPGGFIGVHSGLILTAQSESELAAVLAHEIGHVAQRHIARMIAKQRDSGLIAIGALLLALLASRSGSPSSGQASCCQPARSWRSGASPARRRPSAVTTVRPSGVFTSRNSSFQRGFWSRSAAICRARCGASSSRPRYARAARPAAAFARVGV